MTPTYLTIEDNQLSEPSKISISVRGSGGEDCGGCEPYYNSEGLRLDSILGYSVKNPE